VTLSDPNYLELLHFLYFVLLFISSSWEETKTSNLVGRLIIANPSPGMTNHTHLNLLGSNHISGTAEDRVVKFCIQVEYVKC